MTAEDKSPVRPPTGAADLAIGRTSRGRRRADGLRRLLLLALASGLGWTFLRLGRGELGVPLTTWSGLRQWLDDASPTLLAAALLRVVGLVLCAYLVTVVSVSLGASALGWRRAATATLRLLPLAIRRAVTGGAGLSLATGTILSSLSAPALARQPDRHHTATAVTGGAQLSNATDTILSLRLAAPHVGQPDQDHTATMEKLEPAPGHAPTTTRPSDPPSSVEAPVEPSTTMTVGSEPFPSEPGSVEPPDDPADHGPAAPSPTTPSTTAPPAGLPGEEGEPVPPPSAQPPSTGRPTGTDDSRDIWVVETGDSFWSIAEELVAEHALQHDLVPPSEAAVARYWRSLIGSNQDRLADPANPDLLLPGQELVIPTPGRR